MINEEDKIPVGTAEDFTGQIFGRLKVLYRVKNTGKTRGAKWKCQCSCGNTVEVLAANLKRGHTQSCGCLQKEQVAKTIFIDEIGNRYGRLVVIERGESYVSPSGALRTAWRCQCDCGNITTTSASSLRGGKTMSCGCLNLERISNRCNDKYIGKTFHYITILNKINEKHNSSKESLWNCKCNLCGKEIILSTGKLKTQISCGCLQDSYGVSVIKSLLTNNNIQFETEKTFDSCIFSDSGKKARFDFFVENKYIIEFDGEQHFSYSGGWNNKEQMLATQQKDKKKNDWCMQNNIPIIRIPYWEKDNLSIEDLTLNSRFLLRKDIAEDE